MSKTHEVTVVTGEYTAADGAKKNRYLNIGAVLQTRNGPMLKLEAIPVGWDGWAYLNEPRPPKGQAERPSQQGAHSAARDYARASGGDIASLDNDIPF